MNKARKRAILFCGTDGKDRTNSVYYSTEPNQTLYPTTRGSSFKALFKSIHFDIHSTQARRVLGWRIGRSENVASRYSFHDFVCLFRLT